MMTIYFRNFYLYVYLYLQSSINYIICPKGFSKMPNIIVGNIYYIFFIK